jgi:alanine racemase
VNEPPYTAIHIDTGMNRLGLTMEEVTELARDKGLWKLLHPEWVMSHLACAPDAAHPMNKQQLSAFRKAAAQLPLTPLSLANTAGIYLGKPYHFQMVRPGIGLYGGKATTKPEQEVSRHAVSLLAPILQVREIKKGETVGYDATFTAPEDMRIAIVGAGYADGVPVSMTNTGHDPARYGSADIGPRQHGFDDLGREPGAADCRGWRGRDFPRRAARAGSRKARHDQL